MSSRILRSNVDKRKRESDNHRQGRINKAFVTNQIDNFIKDISNQKRKASNENKSIYDHEIQLFEDMKKFFEFTNVDNSSVFAFYRNFQDKRKEKNQRLRKEIDELNEEIVTLNDQYLNEVAENEKMRLRIEELTAEVTKMDLDQRDLQNKFDRSNTKSKRLEEELSISRQTCKALSDERSEIAIKVNNVLCKKEFAENRIREVEEQYKEDLNSRDFTVFELKNQIVVLKQKVMDLETSLRKISERRLNQSTGSKRSDNETSEHVKSNRSSGDRGDTRNLLDDANVEIYEID
ncbi:13575_t:CDS:2 [Gigaspora rosea]|nr:13575_t:CDS:2 [Gigaspora rosea]